MLPERWLLTLLAALACVAEAWMLASDAERPLVLALEARPREEASATLGLDDPAWVAFAAHMTPDDVARGVWALARETNTTALAPEQSLAIAAHLADGAGTRAGLAALRARRRGAEAALLEDGVALASLLGRGRVAHIGAGP